MSDYAESKIQQKTVQELPYGEVLFDYYQQEYFQSLTKILKADEFDSLQKHKNDGELLKAGLYLSYGMQDAADLHFSNQFQGTADQTQKNRALYYLGKIAYQRGDYGAAIQYLSEIEGALPDNLTGRDQLITALIFFKKKDYDGVIAELKGWTGNQELSHYVKYNLGLASLKNGQTEEGIKLLDKLGREYFSSPELLALKDKSNLTIGLFLLKQENYSEARQYIDRIRLHGPHSEKALLAAGWADAKMNAYRLALIPWKELRQRNVLDPFVQEAILVVPYTLAGSGLNKPAADAYEEALTLFQQEEIRLQASMDELISGDYLRQLVAKADKVEMGWMRELDVIPEAPEPFYLDELLSSHRVQESLKNYRDLLFLDLNLQQWLSSIGAFDDMLALRKSRFETVVPRAQEMLLGDRLATIEQKFSGINAEFISARDKEKIRTFSTADELDKFARLDKLRAKVEQRPDMPAYEYLQRRLNFLTGILYWDIYTTLPSRISKTGENVKDIQQEIQISQSFRTSIERLLEELPKGFEGYSEKIDLQEQDLNDKAQQLTLIIDDQKQQLVKIVQDELAAHLTRIETLKVQAIFALAQIYDRGTKNSEHQADEKEESDGEKG